MPVYLIFLSIFFILPSILLWIFFWKGILLYKRIVLFTIIPTFFFGVPWDLLSVKTGLWRYDSAPTLGIWLLGTHATGLPLEEVLFPIIWSTFLVTVVIVIKKYLK